MSEEQQIERKKLLGLDDDWQDIEAVEDVFIFGLCLCGCGSGEDFALLKEVLVFTSLTPEERDARNALEGKGTYLSAGHELAAKVLNRSGWIEHGTGIGWPWITEKGQKVLALIEELEREPGARA